MTRQIARVDAFLRHGVQPEPKREMAGALCRRLAAYINDASTIRAHVVSLHGEAPSLKHINELIHERRQKRAQIAAVVAKDEPKDTDGEHFTVRGLRQKPPLKLVVPARVASPAMTPVEPAEPRPEPIAPALLPAAFPTAQDVLRASAMVCGVTVAEMQDQNRGQVFCHARNLAAAVLIARGNSLSSAGRFIRRDHTTVISAAQRFFDLNMREPVMRDVWQRMAPEHARAARSYGELRDAVNAWKYPKQAGESK